MVIQGREITAEDIRLVRQLIATHSSWHRTRVSEELCRLWGWYSQSGQLKGMACRSFLLKLEARGYINLPPRRYASGGKKTRKPSYPSAAHQTSPIVGPLAGIAPIEVKVAKRKYPIRLFKYLISCYHYLHFNGIVGENMKYLVFDREGRCLACLLFGSAAWKTSPRDEFIGWSPKVREANLQYITNNMRFLILPWVKVPHLASHILGKVARRISSDWQERYGHPIYMLETFVEKDRFRGTCYRAANWICVGQSKGRSRNDRYSTLKVAIKDIYLLPLTKRFRELLVNQGKAELLSLSKDRVFCN